MKALRRLAVCALVGLSLGAVATASFADPKPLPVPGPSPDPKPGGKEPVKFPMTSTSFKPFFDKIMSQLEAAAARAQDEAPAPGWAEQMRFRASQATEDGTVTQQEFLYIMAVIRKTKRSQ